MKIRYSDGRYKTAYATAEESRRPGYLAAKFKAMQKAPAAKPEPRRAAPPILRLARRT